MTHLLLSLLSASLILCSYANTFHFYLTFFQALSILLMHLLGDLPSPMIVGIISDLVHDARITLLLLCLWLFWTVAFWAGAAHFARRRVNAMKLNLMLKMQQSDEEATEAAMEAILTNGDDKERQKEIDQYLLQVENEKDKRHIRADSASSAAKERSPRPQNLEREEKIAERNDITEMRSSNENNLASQSVNKKKVKKRDAEPVMNVS
jgi:hypothetical protein